MLKRKLAIVNLVGLIFGFVGGVLLIVSLSLKTSNYSLFVTNNDGPKEVVTVFGSDGVALVAVIIAFQKRPCYVNALEKARGGTDIADFLAALV
jgi:hypothetical protein